MKIEVYFVLVLLMITSLLSGCVTDEDSIIYDGRIRFYLLHLPKSYNPSTPTPLVIALHGGGGNAHHMEEKTGFSLLADEERFIVVYPEGTGRLKHRGLTWNAGYCCGYALENNVDDVGFIETLIKKLESEYNIDPNRIYVTGHSNGAMLTYRVGAELSNIVAAIAPVAGSIGGYATNDSPLWVIPEPKYPVSVVAIHGLLDAHVPYYGGHGSNATGSRIDLSVNESISFWVQHDDCDSTPIREVYGNIVKETYSNGSNNTEVALYTILDGDHRWPGSYIEEYKNFSATRVIWDFFKSHPKNI